MVLHYVAHYRSFSTVVWNYDELASQYIESCWDGNAAKIGAFVFAFQHNTIESHSASHRGTAIELATEL